VVVLVKRLGIAFAISLLPNNGAYSSTTVILLLLFGWSLSYFLEPWTNEWENRLDLLCHVVNLATFAMKLSLNEHQSAVFAHITVIVLNVGLLLFSLVAVALTSFRNARH
jgi:hypothetical protein